MSELIPNRFLFDIEIPLRFRRDPPPIDGRLTGWTDEERLPLLGELDGRRDFAEVWTCWNESGLFFACRVEGRHTPLSCDPKNYWNGDNVRLCIDTRDARTIKRATRTCHQFFLLPAGGGALGDRPVAGTGKLQRAREDAPPTDGARLRVAADVHRAGYTLEAHVPGECLHGFDPADHSRLGFYYIIEDRDLGQQYLTVGDELYWYVDPSTWATVVLARSCTASK
jgi:hypothetical protein